MAMNFAMFTRGHTQPIQPPAALLLGIFSVASDRERRDAMRTTWVAEARDLGLRSLTARFVLGREAREQLATEQQEHGDLVQLDCAENQHKGKTFLWFRASLRLAERFDYVAKMDQDVLLWPAELAADLRGFAPRAFYGGLPVDVFRMYFEDHRMQFVNGGLAILSRDLAQQIDGMVERALPLQSAAANASGFLEDSEELRAAGIDLRGNEDVALGRAFRADWLAGRLVPNDGSGFGWARLTPTDHGPRGDVLGRPCPWRHASDLKSAAEYVAQWARRTDAQHGCRCVCPPERPPDVADAAARGTTRRPAKQREERRALGDGRGDGGGGGDGDGDGTLQRRPPRPSYPPSGRDMLRLTVVHKTDGVGGHVRSATTALGAAAVLGLRLVCDPAMLYNGHLAQSEPHIGSRLLLGCDHEGELEADGAGGRASGANAASVHYRVAARSEAAGAKEVAATSWADLAERLRARQAALSAAKLAAEPRPPPPVVFTLPDAADAAHFHGRCTPPRARLWPAAASLLRERYHRDGAPERLAAPLWGSIGGAAHAACTRVTLQWRTAAWSLRSRGSRRTAGGWLRAVFGALLGGDLLGGGGGRGGDGRGGGSQGGGSKGGCARVALIAQMKEDKPSQLEVRAEMDALLRELNGDGSPHAAAAFVTHSSKSAFDPDAALGADDPAALARDLALMATAQLLLVGESQLSRLAAALQPEDGAHAHLVADSRFYVDGQPGPAGTQAAGAGQGGHGQEQCKLLRNTILADDALERARLAADEAGRESAADPFAAFVRGPKAMRPRLATCTQYDAPADVDELLRAHADCPEPPPDVRKQRVEL